jgi:hypothetical protein
MKEKNTTLSEQIQNLIEKSQDGNKSEHVPYCVCLYLYIMKRGVYH